LVGIDQGPSDHRRDDTAGALKATHQATPEKTAAGHSQETIHFLFVTYHVVREGDPKKEIIHFLFITAQGRNREKSGEIGRNREKSGEIGRNREKSGEIGNQTREKSVPRGNILHN
jgi:hypothetical protein